MDRRYFVRGKQVTVDEISDVLAIKLESPVKTQPSEIAKRFGPLATETPNINERGLFISDEEQKAFHQAGYVFVHPHEEATRAIRSGKKPKGIVSIGRIFRDSKGHILVGSNRLTVKLKQGISDQKAQSLLREKNLGVLRQLKFAPKLYEVSVGEDKDPLDVAFELHNNDNFEYAEPVMTQHIDHRFKPTDPNYNRQWQWNNNGSDGGTQDADIHAEAAWDITRGEGVRIALIDNGCDVSHPDLKKAIVAGAGYFQDDGAGGAHFISGLTGFPDGNHGTFCAGIIIAKANNNVGGCGVANLADFIPVACLGDQVGSQTTLARAIAYAADPTTEIDGANHANGAHVISCSLGPNGGNWQMESVLKDAIDFAVNSGRGGLGTPIFWAVSNGNFPVAQDEVCSYVNTIAVGRSTNRDTENGSAFGPELDFLAPGVNVYSTNSGSGYGNGTGTSYATPCAAGVAALLLATHPKFTWDQVRKVMRDTCDKIGGVNYGADGHHDRYGFGRVNAIKAVSRDKGNKPS